MVSGRWAGVCDDGWEFVDRMAVGQVKTRLDIVEDQQPSCIDLDVDDIQMSVCRIMSKSSHSLLGIRVRTCPLHRKSQRPRSNAF